MGSFYTIATIRPQPRPVKKMTITHTKVYDGSPNISIPTTMPSTPLMTITLTPPTETGDEPFQKRYAVGTGLLVYNGSSSTATVTVRVKIGNNIKESSASLGAAYYGTWRGLIYYTPPANLEIYAQASVSGCTLYRVYAATTGYHIFSNYVCTVFIYEITNFARVDLIAGTSDHNAAPVQMRHDTYTETTHTSPTKVRVTGALRPNLYADEYFGFLSSNTSLCCYMFFYYPRWVMWGEA